MPRYDWKCQTCNAVTEVYRSMAQSDLGPHQPCGRCRSHNFKKAISRPEVMIPGGRSESSTWPVTISKAEKFMLRNPDGSFALDHKGVPLVGYKDVTFKNAAEQKEWLNRNGKELLMDGEADSTKGSSEASFYDQRALPPSAEAASVASRSFFVEDPNEVADIAYSKIEPILVETSNSDCMRTA